MRRFYSCTEQLVAKLLREGGAVSDEMVSILIATEDSSIGSTALPPLLLRPVAFPSQRHGGSNVDAKTQVPAREE
jgi:hypothetical protein